MTVRFADCHAPRTADAINAATRATTGQPVCSSHPPSRPDSLPPLLVDYATKVIASVDRDEPATIKAACAALRPIDVFREGTQARAAGGTEPPKTPEALGNGT